MGGERETALRECICRNCPSWISCRENIAYCLSFVGKSKCISEEKGCICGACPVTNRMGLKHGYYCTRGSEEEQLNANMEKPSEMA